MNETDEQTGNRKWTLPFFTIWTGQAFSLLGSSLVQFALIWWLTKTTGSATVLATASLVGLIPQVLLGPIAGAFIDRWNRRITMMVADSISALAVVVLGVLFYIGGVQVWHVYLLMFIRSCAGAFHWPAMQASTSLMVPKDQLSRVQGMNQLLMGVINIASAPLGALLLSFVPMQGILAIDVTTAAIAITPLLFVTVPQPERRLVPETPGGKTSLWQDLRAGFRYVASWPGLIMLGLMATMINFFLNPAFSMLPILVTDHFGGEALEIAWTQSAWGIGVVAGGLILSVWGGFRKKLITSLMGVITMGIAMAIIGLTPSGAFLLVVGMLFLSGLANPIANGPLMAIFQSVVEPEMQGRVLTLISSVAGAMTPLGLLIAGPFADRFGVQMWFIIGGAITLAMGIGAYFVPALMNLENGRNKEEAGEASQPGLVIETGD